MDENLRTLLDTAPDSRDGATFRVRSDGSGEIEVDTPDGPRTYTLKGLRELYGNGRGNDASVDPKDVYYQPLLQAIEGEIVRFQKDNAWLTDGAVGIALGKLSMGLESDQSEPLAKRIQAALRLAVSLNDYSRQEVRQALRHVIRSVERHTKIDGPRGYLRFIREFFPDV